MARITGRVSVLVNNVPLLNREGAVANGIGPNGLVPFEREPVMTDNGIAGFKETAVEASVEVTVVDRNDIELSPLLELDGQDATVLFQAEPTGKQYKLVNVFSSGVATLTAGEGETALKFIGEKWYEELA
jgi:hypothetical protein